MRRAAPEFAGSAFASHGSSRKKTRWPAGLSSMSRFRPCTGVDTNAHKFAFVEAGNDAAEMGLVHVQTSPEVGGCLFSMFASS